MLRMLEQSAVYEEGMPREQVGLRQERQQRERRRNKQVTEDSEKEEIKLFSQGLKDAQHAGATTIAQAVDRATEQRAAATTQQQRLESIKLYTALLEKGGGSATTRGTGSTSPASRCAPRINPSIPHCPDPSRCARAARS